MTINEGLTLLNTAEVTDASWTKNPVLTQRQAWQIMKNALENPTRRTVEADGVTLSALMEKNVRRACKP
jgi:hypothetical protein